MSSRLDGDYRDVMEQRIQIQIIGMHCGHCVQAIEEALTALPGVHECHVAVGRAQVAFDDKTVKKPDLLAAIRRAGTYDVASFSQAGSP